MMGIPSGDPKRWYDFLRTQLLDRESREDFEFPAEYMFKNVPHFEEHWDDPVGYLLSEMDKHGIARSMVGTSFKNDQAQKAIADSPGRFFGSFEVDPNRGMEAVRELEAAVRELGVKAATAFPAGLTPQVPINDKKFYPIYAKCVELDIPICVCAGVPGPRVPFAPQQVSLIDEVCWFFPELKFVTRHGCEPWADLAVKLMLKWPNLYYSTSAFAPKYYPKDVVQFANTRGADKVMYAGYFPMGLTLDRIFDDMPGVPFRDHVWPKFLRDNATRVFKLDE
jgi:predicted TIM-barrel fold metal-dependent hydrolase